MKTNTQAEQFSHVPMWIAGIAVVLFSAIGVAVIMGWIPLVHG